jgi:hypothetical protein
MTSSGVCRPTGILPNLPVTRRCKKLGTVRPLRLVPAWLACQSSYIPNRRTSIAICSLSARAGRATNSNHIHLSSQFSYAIQLVVRTSVALRGSYSLDSSPNKATVAIFVPFYENLDAAISKDSNYHPEASLVVSYASYSHHIIDVPLCGGPGQS